MITKYIKRGRVLQLQGIKFGNLTAVKISGLDTYNRVLWQCECICRKDSIVASHHLVSGAVRSCGIGSCNSAWQGHEAISKTYWTSTKRNAFTRNLAFNVSIEFAWDLYIKQNRKCYLSGLPITFSGCSTNLSRKLQTASLDRINSDIGYEENNVAWCHKDVNTMKMDFNIEEFVRYCKLIGDNYISK